MPWIYSLSDEKNMRKLSKENKIRLLHKCYNGSVGSYVWKVSFLLFYFLSFSSLFFLSFQEEVIYACSLFSLFSLREKWLKTRSFHVERKKIQKKVFNILAHSFIAFKLAFFSILSKFLWCDPFGLLFFFLIFLLIAAFAYIRPVYKWYFAFIKL